MFVTGLHVQRIVLGVVGKVEEHDSGRLEERQSDGNLRPRFEMLPSKPVLMSHARRAAGAPLPHARPTVFMNSAVFSWRPA